MAKINKSVKFDSGTIYKITQEAVLQNRSWNNMLEVIALQYCTREDAKRQKAFTPLTKTKKK